MQDSNIPQKGDLKRRQIIKPQTEKIKIFGIELSAVILGIIISLGVYLVMFSARQASDRALINNQPSEAAIATPSPSPTPMPFVDMTIPYLRARIYESKLGEQKKEYETDTYTAYLTNYNSDGLKINGLLTIPKGAKPKEGFPAIIFIHGYIPPTSYGTTRNYYDYVDYLARNGFIIFKIDLRGHGSSEGVPSGTYYSPDYVIDTLNAYAALQNFSDINPANIGLWGHSMAGNIVMRVFAAKPEIKGVVIWAGAVYSYVDFRSYGIQDASYQPPQMDDERLKRREELFKTHGQPSKDSIFWQQVAPTNFLSDLKGAIQIHHSTDDNVVSIGYSRNLKSLLDQTSIPHNLYEYTSGGHNIAGISYTQAMQRTVEFFMQNLK